MLYLEVRTAKQEEAISNNTNINIQNLVMFSFYFTYSKFLHYFESTEENMALVLWKRIGRNLYAHMPRLEGNNLPPKPSSLTLILLYLRLKGLGVGLNYTN